MVRYGFRRKGSTIGLGGNVDKVKLQIHNKVSKETYIKSEIYDRGELESWLERQANETGNQFFERTIIEIE